VRLGKPVFDRGDPSARWLGTRGLPPLGWAMVHDMADFASGICRLTMYARVDRCSLFSAFLFGLLGVDADGAKYADGHRHGAIRGNFILRRGPP
jgi:hypothetical protein